MSFRISLSISLSLESGKRSTLKGEVVLSRKLVVQLSSLVNLGKLSMLKGHVGEFIENFERWLVFISVKYSRALLIKGNFLLHSQVVSHWILKIT